MAMRRPRTNSRLTAKSNQQQQQGVAERDEDGGERGGKPRKRKLSDMLGPPWSKDDLELFYQAYRKYGKDWKKVAGSMPKRTMEMVEAVYGMNKAYLSLPEGSASATGLIAMMTDHYNILDDSEEESSEEVDTSDRSHQMQSRSRTRGANANNANSGPSGYGGPSPAKKPRSVAAGRPWVVGKRTPRYPVGNVVEQKGKNKPVMNKVHQEDNSDEENDLSNKAEVVALALVTASQQAPSSPLISKTTPTRRYTRAPLQNGHAKESSFKAESGGSVPKLTASTSGEVDPEGSQESKEKPARASTRMTIDENEPADRAKGQVADGKGRWKKPPAKKPKLQKQEGKCDEANEQCSQTGIADGETRDTDEEKHISIQKKKLNSSQRTMKRSRQLFSGDQSSALDALATLADLSLNGLLPSPTPRSDSEKEEDKSQRSESVPQIIRGAVEKNGKEVEKREGNNKVHEDEMSKEHLETEELQVGSGSRQQSTSPPDSRKRKRKSNPEKITPPGKSGADEQGQSIDEPEVPLPKVETPRVQKPRRKPKSLTTAKTVSKQGLKVNNAGDGSGLNLELSVPGTDQHGPEAGGTLPLKIRTKKKGVPEKGPVNGFGCVSNSGVPEEIVKEAASCPHASAEHGPFNTKARLIHCLSPKVRRWCMYEWFYSAIDLPWFAHNEFVEYLNHAGLGHVPRLTRVEWGVIRSSLGKPRRLSKSFLQEEREKLAKYRENVRTHYQELRNGVRDGLPLDLARPLTVGQRVIAKHPKTGQIHDGSILTVDRSRCRVQFDRTDLGVEFVMDIDAMPVHPLDNMPEIMRRKRTVLDAVDRQQEDSKLDMKSRVAISAGGAARAALNERLERPGSMPELAAISPIFLNNLIKTAQANSVDAVRFAKAASSEAVAVTQQALLTQPYTPGLSQARESDIRALSQLGAALNKKEPLVVELRRMNVETQTYKDSEAFQRQYSSVVLQVKAANEEVLEAIKHLRNRNRYQDLLTPSWQRGISQVPSANGGPGPADGSLPGPPDSDTAIADIATTSKKHARAMVSVAVQSMSNLEEGEDPLVKIGGALDLIAKGNPPMEGKSAPGPTSSTQGFGSVMPVTFTASASQTLAVNANGDIDKSADVHRAPAGDTPTPNVEDTAKPEHVDRASRGEGKEMILSELMASCVATLLMVQSLTERQFPAPEVALTLDTALESLRPQAAQNLFIFKDIEQQLEYIKAQILAQIPIQTSLPFTVDSPSITQPNPT
ncbi:unnamed protein product [Calypogeia fissa]